MRIQNNITAMNTHRQYTINNDNVARSAEKLSSGYRINRAGDDAAGLAISEKMRSQIRGLNMATKNSQDAISLVQTAEGALQETQNMLQRMNELAVQAATGTNETLDRSALAKEFEQLKKEINDIAEQTNFNNMKILDGSLSYSGYVRSAATAGVTSTQETMTSASGMSPMVAGNPVTGSDYAAKVDEPKGSTFTLAATEDGLGDTANNKSYALKVKIGDETVTVTSKEGSGRIADLFDGQKFTTSDGATWTAKAGADGLSFEREVTPEDKTPHSLKNVAISANLSEVSGSGKATSVTTTDGEESKGAGWNVTGADLDATTEAGKTYKVTLTTAGGTPVPLNVIGEEGKSLGELTAKAINAAQTTGNNEGIDLGYNDANQTQTTEYQAEWSVDEDGVGTLRLKESADPAVLVGGTTQPALTVTAGKPITLGTDVATDVVPGVAGTSPGSINVDLSNTNTADFQLVEGKAYTLEIKDGTDVYTVSVTATGEENSFADLFANATLTDATDPTKELKVQDLGEGNAIGNLRILTGTNRAWNDAANAPTFSVTESVASAEAIADAPLDNETQEATGGPASITIETSNSTGNTNPLDLADTRVGGKDYTLKIQDANGKTVELTLADSEVSGTTGLGAALAAKYDGTTNKIEIDGVSYKVVPTASSDATKTAIALEAIGDDAEEVKAGLQGKLTATLIETDATPMKQIDGPSSQESELRKGDGKDFQLKSRDYTLDEKDLKVGDSLSIGGKTYTVGNATAKNEAGEPEADKNGNFTIAKEDFLNTVAGLVSVDAEGRGLKMIVNPETTDEEGNTTALKGFRLEETATASSGDADPVTGAGMERSDADVTAKFTTSTNLTKTTVEFDFAKMYDGDKVTINIDGMEPLNVEKQAGDTRTSFMERITKELESRSTDKDFARVNGNALIVQGAKVTIESELKADGLEDKATNALRIQVGALENEQLDIAIDSMNTKGLGLDDAHLLDPNNTTGAVTFDQDAAGRAITAVRDAINKVSDQRATLGAMQNRLDHKIANLKVSSENLSAAESRIRDVDMASEMTNFTKNQILSQAATAMLAQANALPQNVLSLLG